MLEAATQLQVVTRAAAAAQVDREVEQLAASRRAAWSQAVAALGARKAAANEARRPAPWLQPLASVWAFISVKSFHLHNLSATAKVTRTQERALAHVVSQCQPQPASVGTLGCSVVECRGVEGLPPPDAAMLWY